MKRAFLLVTLLFGLGACTDDYVPRWVVHGFSAGPDADGAWEIICWEKGTDRTKTIKYFPDERADQPEVGNEWEPCATTPDGQVVQSK